jgi:two-component system, NtrC family, sensor histidine kinase GlrK
MSRLRSGRPAKLESGCDIDRVLEAAIEDERDEAEQRGVTVELATGVARAPSLRIDSALVERAIANLVRNALSVSRAGQVVRVRRETIGGASERIRVEVGDDGPGIDDALRPNLFRPFSSAAVRSIDRPAGIGIGLSFAREVARVHGGDLVLVSSDASGTTFRFELPLTSEERA